MIRHSERGAFFMPEWSDTMDINTEKISEAFSELARDFEDYATNVLAPILQDISDKYDIKEPS